MIQPRHTTPPNQGDPKCEAQLRDRRFLQTAVRGKPLLRYTHVAPSSPSDIAIRVNIDERCMGAIHVRPIVRPQIMESLGARSAIATALTRVPSTKNVKKARNGNLRTRASAKDEDAVEKTKSAVSGK